MSSLNDSEEHTSPPATPGSRGVQVASSHFSKISASKGNNGCLKNIRLLLSCYASENYKFKTEIATMIKYFNKRKKDKFLTKKHHPQKNICPRLLDVNSFRLTLQTNLQTKTHTHKYTHTNTKHIRSFRVHHWVIINIFVAVNSDRAINVLLQIKGQ